MRILIVEDEEKIAELIENRLKKENYSIDIAYDGEDGSYKALTGIYDLILLDVMLPFKDGFTILKEIHNNDIGSQIIMLTARASIEDKLSGFNLGADDYITKPFHLEELVARVNSKLRKLNKKDNNNCLIYGDIKLDLKKKTISSLITGEEIEVLCKEFMLLEYLINNSKQVISKESLYDNVWGIDSDAISNNLEAYISFIRKKLKLLDSKVNIKAMRGLGYKLEVLNE